MKPKYCSMTRTAKKFLFDISNSIENIFIHHLNGLQDEHEFDQNITAIRAVEREFGIIGGAAKNLHRIGIELTNYDKLINRRNTLVHEYDSMKTRTLWQYIQYELPDLKLEVENMLEEK